jgi:colicin import membrane protein
MPRRLNPRLKADLYDASSYTGKTCTLRIKLAPDGMLLDSVKSEGGDPGFVSGPGCSVGEDS